MEYRTCGDTRWNWRWMIHEAKLTLGSFAQEPKCVQTSVERITLRYYGVRWGGHQCAWMSIGHACVRLQVCVYVCVFVSCCIYDCIICESLLFAMYSCTPCGRRQRFNSSIDLRDFEKRGTRPPPPGSALWILTVRSASEHGL